MPTLDEITAGLSRHIEEALSVVVARKGSDGEMEARKLALAENAAEGFRNLCRDTLDSLQTQSAKDYTADAELDANEVFILDDQASLEELADLRDLATSAATLPSSAPRDLDLSIQFYAVVVGDRSRVLLLRRSDPQIKYTAGRFLAIAGEQLRRLDEPAFSFAPGFDIVIADEWVVVLNQVAFERLFREIGIIERHIATWVTGITDYLPMESASVTLLQQVASGDSRTWRRLREIHRRGHLAHVGLAEVRRYAKGMGLDPSKIVQKGQLVFDPTERFSFLHLLNEDLYHGPLTEEMFEAQRKSTASTT
ncbi:MAG TPA: Kiwa anti-phage protein KwaB-like domain-containing protein [Acidimicrobiales bacterium]|nr:Kiwa anti-phage protein KwaB-like domain-containing protein [Acidimicrobiales bacterium]